MSLVLDPLLSVRSCCMCLVSSISYDVVSQAENVSGSSAKLGGDLGGPGWSGWSLSRARKLSLVLPFLPFTLLTLFALSN